MTCEELLEALNEHVDGANAEAVCAEFAAHLAGCDPCQVVVDNIRQSIALFKAGEPYPMPAEFQDKLRASLKESWNKKFGK